LKEKIATVRDDYKGMQKLINFILLKLLQAIFWLVKLCVMLGNIQLSWLVTGSWLADISI